MTARRVLLPVFILIFLASGEAMVAGAPVPADKATASKLGDDHGYQPAAGAFATIADEIEPNDTPATAQPVAVGDAIRAGLVAGDVDYFAVDGSPGAWLTLSTSSSDGSSIDTVMEVYGGDGTFLLTSDDDSGMGLFSALLHFSSPGSFYVAVRHFGANGFGDYVFGVETGTPPPFPPANGTPMRAAALDCGQVTQGTTVGGLSDVSGAMACMSFEPNGEDVFFVLELPYSYQLSLSLFPHEDVDLSLYVFTDPNDPIGSCLLGSDLGFDGEGELLIYVNETEGPPMTLYVGVDSWSSQVAGGFVLSGDCEFVVANESTSWGSVKVRYQE